MAKKKLWARVAISYPIDERTDKAIQSAGGTGAMIEKLIQEGGEEKAQAWMDSHYIHVKAGDQLVKSIPGKGTVNGKRVSVEKHYLETGRISTTDPSKE